MKCKLYDRKHAKDFTQVVWFNPYKVSPKYFYRYFTGDNESFQNDYQLVQKHKMSLRLAWIWTKAQTSNYSAFLIYVITNIPMQSFISELNFNMKQSISELIFEYVNRFNNNVICRPVMTTIALTNTRVWTHTYSNDAVAKSFYFRKEVYYFWNSYINPPISCCN